MAQNKNSEQKNPSAERLRQMQATYSQTLPEKLAAVVDSWSSIRTLNNFNPPLLQSFRSKVHSLAASGASYKYYRLSRLMQKLEQKINQLGDFPEDANRLVLNIDDMITSLPAEAVPDSPETTSEGLLLAKSKQRPAEPKILFALGGGAKSQALSEQLAHYGFSVRVCQPPDLQDVVTDFAPDVVFFQEDLEGLHRCPSPRDLNVASPPDFFLLSAQPNVETRIRAFRDGSREVLYDPPDISTLLAKIDDCFNEAHGELYGVLIVDDDAQLAHHHATILGHAGFITKIVTVPMEVEEALNYFEADVILMDLHMPDYNGIELAAALRQDPSLFGVPIIFISTERDIVRHLGAIKVGGDDFLIKPVGVPYLLASVETRARRGRELRSLIRSDGLTGLYNHASIDDSLQQMIARTSRLKADLSLAMIDMDHFKKVNDTYGHLMGDRVLIDFARFLKGRLRQSDIVGRFGGEEFMLILPDTSPADAYTLLESMRVSFAAVNHNTVEVPVRVCFSAGIASFPRFKTAADITKGADDALYQAKTHGRNCIVSAGDAEDSGGIEDSGKIKK